MLADEHRQPDRDGCDEEDPSHQEPTLALTELLRLLVLANDLGARFRRLFPAALRPAEPVATYNSVRWQSSHDGGPQSEPLN
jgi:hypothetical protein